MSVPQTKIRLLPVQPQEPGAEKLVEDAEIITEILQHDSASFSIRDPLFIGQTIRKEMKTGSQFLLASQQNSHFGVASWRPDWDNGVAEIERFFIVSGYQRQGHGKAFLRKLIHEIKTFFEAKKISLKKVVVKIPALETRVRIALLNFLMRMGFRTDDFGTGIFYKMCDS